MKFLGSRKEEVVLEILGVMAVIQKEDKYIFQDGLKEELNNILIWNKQKPDVKLSNNLAEVLQSGKENGVLDQEKNSLDLDHKKHHSYTNVNQDLTVGRDMIMFTFLDGHRIVHNNITTEILV